MPFIIRPALLFFIVSLFVFGGCTMRPQFTPTTESSKTFQIMYQDSASAQAAPAVKGQHETLKSLEK